MKNGKLVFVCEHQDLNTIEIRRIDNDTYEVWISDFRNEFSWDKVGTFKSVGPAIRRCIEFLSADADLLEIMKGMEADSAHDPDCPKCKGSGTYKIDPGTLETGPQKLIEETCDCSSIENKAIKGK